MEIIILLIVGGLTGWIASLIMQTNGQMGLLLNILVGIIGAFLGSWLFGTVLGFSSATTGQTINIVGFLWGILGAVILIWILKLFSALQ